MNCGSLSVVKLSNTKTSLRKSLRNTLRSFSSETRLKKSQSVSKNLRQFFLTINSDDIISVGGFAPTSTEVSWFFDLESLNLTFLYPYPLENDEMDFRYSDYKNLVESTLFGPKILVPSEECEVAIPDVMIIPGIAFTIQGSRLGQGSGYYDKYLKNYNGKKIGICFNEQVLPDLPCEEHDIQMDYIINESGTEHCLSA